MAFLGGEKVHVHCEALLRSLLSRLVLPCPALTSVPLALFFPFPMGAMIERYEGESSKEIILYRKKFDLLGLP